MFLGIVTAAGKGDARETNGNASVKADERRLCRMNPEENCSIFANDPQRWNKATGPISATVCSVLEGVWKPRTQGFWQAPDANATLDGALFNKAQIVDSFSRDMEMQTWKKAAENSPGAGMEKSIITDFAKKARSQLIREKNFWLRGLWIF